ncbi:MAG: cobalt-precorrin-5B (C(1))-methyltransferase [Magnetococcales bacterium]|nr:cobalt-precorrin-5B (C(1))-methyltransferase [Magnetococcales bacterium]
MKKGDKTFSKGTRTGFTTGACSAAAARAATLGLIRGELPRSVETTLPNGQQVLFPVAAGKIEDNLAIAVVIKDAGDDPDVTHGAHLTAQVRWLPSHPHQIVLLGGAGVGRVTRPGVGLPVGEAAINPIPQQNIIDNVRYVAQDLLVKTGLEVTISVPDGEIMAKKTLNGRLGIVNGISILGTGGVVHPYSTSAYKASVRQAVEAAAALQVSPVVFTTGRRTERFAMSQMVDLPDYAFIQMGDFFGAAMKSAGQARIPHVIVAAMVGKLAKIGQGMENTHAHKNSLDMQRVAQLAAQAGANKNSCRLIAQGVTVRHAADHLAEQGLESPFYQLLAQEAIESMQSRLPAECRATVLAFDFAGKLLARVEGKSHG